MVDIDWPMVEILRRQLLRMKPDLPETSQFPTRKLGGLLNPHYLSVFHLVRHCLDY